MERRIASNPMSHIIAHSAQFGGRRLHDTCRFDDIDYSTDTRLTSARTDHRSSLDLEVKSGTISERERERRGGGRGSLLSPRSPTKPRALDALCIYFDSMRKFRPSPLPSCCLSRSFARYSGTSLSSDILLPPPLRFIIWRVRGMNVLRAQSISAFSFLREEE